MDDSSTHNVWRSYSDMMSGLLLLFVLIMAVCLMQAQKNYTEKLAEQAKQIQTQNELEASQQTVDEQQEQLSAQEQTLAEQAATLEALQAALEAQQLALDTKESELNTMQTTLTQRESELTASQSALNQKESELALSQSQLDEANQLMIAQQTRIDQIVGVKADLIAALNDEFKVNQINVQIDTETGAILLDSSVLFDYNESVLTDAGTQILNQVLPVYCRVLLSEEYADYVAEVIIDGYTDSTGDYLTNLDLSQGRAYAVASYLFGSMSSFLSEAEQGELLSKLTANGKSSSNLIYTEDGREDSDASRRVEIKFRLKDEEMLAELQAIIEESQAATAGETTVVEADDTAEANDNTAEEDQAAG